MMRSGWSRWRIEGVLRLAFGFGLGDDMIMHGYQYLHFVLKPPILRPSLPPSLPPCISTSIHSAPAPPA
jgi:hypothetical protein